MAIPFAALVIGAGLVAVPSYFRTAPSSPPEMRLQVVTPSSGSDAGIVSFDLSPDGQSLVFVAATEEGTQLWLRTLSSETARPLAGTENSLRPFWSPDGLSIGFSSDRKLKRVDVGGGSVQILGELATIFGASWGASGVIVFAGANTAPLYRVAATGGQEPVEATRLMPGQLSHRFPHFLPDGRRFLFYATGAPDVQGVYLGTLDSLDATRLLEADTAAVFVPPAWVLFGRGEALYAQRIDVEGRVAVGEPVLVVDRVARNPATFATVALSASVSGVFAYRAGIEDAARELAIVNRQGREERTLGAISGLGGAISISPDGRTVAANRSINGNIDVWLIETARGVLRRFTFHAANESAPVWSPDGNWITFHSARKGGGLNDLYRKPVGGGEEELLLESSENKNVGNWSGDGRFFAFASQSSKTGRDIWALPSQGDQKPQVVLQTEFAETSPRFSPDGRWIAYESNETGRVEVFVQPFPGPARNWQISTAGGTAPQWRGDGREIFYLDPDNRVMAASFGVTSNGSAVEVGISVPLFSVRPGTSYAATRDGQRFFISRATSERSALPITVVLNWKPPAQ